MYKELEDKYIDLLVNRCLTFKKSKALFIDYPSDLDDFVNRLVQKVKDMGIDDICLNRTNREEKHSILLNSTPEEIEKNPYFSHEIWDTYAKKNSAFLVFSSVFPHFYDDIESEKILASAKASRTTKPIYREKQKNGDISWCIAVMPNKVWAKDKFPELSESDAYHKLFSLMMDATMVNSDNPVKMWNDFLDNQRMIVDKLNKLKIKKMHYTNGLGTDLELELTDESIWQSAGYEYNDRLVNMPSYEVFSSPNKWKTNGIVYAALPLTYSGRIIEDFWIKFKDGKVIDFDAKTGKEVLESIIKSDDNSSFLGEVALVSKNSAIAKLNFVFGETCLDENASCHLALGDSYPDCVRDGLKKTREELDCLGLNKSNTHVDFMMGTSDLNIWAETNEGMKHIFKDGEFNL